MDTEPASRDILYANCGMRNLSTENLLQKFWLNSLTNFKKYDIIYTQRKREVTTMTYSVEAHNCSAVCRYSVEFMLDDLDEAMDIADALECGFREVRITNLETGEIEYSRYCSESTFGEEDRDEELFAIKRATKMWEITQM
jgi:hypothetical protein